VYSAQAAAQIDSPASAKVGTGTSEMAEHVGISAAGIFKCGLPKWACVEHPLAYMPEANPTTAPVRTTAPKRPPLDVAEVLQEHEPDRVSSAFA